ARAGTAATTAAGDDHALGERTGAGPDIRRTTAASRRAVAGARAAAVEAVLATDGHHQDLARAHREHAHDVRPEGARGWMEVAARIGALRTGHVDPHAGHAGGDGIVLRRAHEPESRHRHDAVVRARRRRAGHAPGARRVVRRVDADAAVTRRLEGTQRRS